MVSTSGEYTLGRVRAAKNYVNGHPHYVLGLDLGQAHDFTALAVLQRKLKPAGPPYNVRTRINSDLYGSEWGMEERRAVENHYLVRHLGRPPLRTSYTDIADGVIERIRA